MQRYLLNHIRELESKLTHIQEKEEKLKKIATNLKKLFRPVLDVNIISKDMKEKINRYINSLINNLGEEESITQIYKGNMINKNMFFELIKNIDKDKQLLFIFKLRDSKAVEFASSFIESKFTPFLFVSVNKVIGILDKSKLKEFEKTHFIPFFQNGKYEELKFFVIFFEVNDFSQDEFIRANSVYDRFYLKPSMLEKSFVHYSLSEEKIIDFEMIEKEKIKKEFSFINELKYPEIENLIRKEVRNHKFVLALLDRVDNELNSIKKSKGTIIVVKRILSFVHRHQLDPQIQEMNKLIFQELEDA